MATPGVETTVSVIDHGTSAAYNQPETMDAATTMILLFMPRSFSTGKEPD